MSKAADYLNIQPDVIDPKSIKLSFYKNGKCIAKDILCAITVNKRTKTNQAKYQEGVYLGRKILNIFTTKDKLIGCYFSFNNQYYYIKNEHDISMSNVHYTTKYQATEINDTMIDNQLKEVVVDMITEEDIGYYIQKCLSLQDDSNIYYGYKQEVDAQQEQMNNKFNISIYFTEFELDCNSYDDNYKQISDDLCEKVSSARGTFYFSIHVFNWLNKVSKDENDNLQEERYDCIDKMMQIFMYFNNRNNFCIVDSIKNRSIRNNDSGTTLIEYTIKISAKLKEVRIKESQTFFDIIKDAQLENTFLIK